MGEALIKRVVAETNLGRSLRTLSIPLARPGLCPEDVEALAGFTQLRKLALYSSLDDDGTCGGGYGGGYGSSDEQEKAQPFCGPLLTVVQCILVLRGATHGSTMHTSSARCYSR